MIDYLNHYKVPEILVDGEEFKGLSAEAIILYSMPTAIKTLDELDVKKGIGLIERVRLVLGKPNIIYVKDFMSVFQVKEHDFQKSKNFTSEVKKMNFKR